MPAAGTYMIEHVGSLLPLILDGFRRMDAHESTNNATNDFSLVTRLRQNNDSQRWVLSAVGDGSFTIQQKSSGRFVDAHESTNNEFATLIGAGRVGA